MTPHIPVIALDPHGTDHHGEAAKLRELGPVVRVQLPGDVMAWSVTDHALLNEMIADPRFSKDWRNWNAIIRGEISDGWPLIGMVKVTNMVTSDGQEHRRLRKLVTQTFTPRRVQELRPRIQQIVDDLLDDLPSHAAADGSVDLRRHFAHPVPMQVICDLFGVPADERPRLQELMDNIFRSDLLPEEVSASQIEQYELLARVVESRRREPGSDLTSALIAARAADPDALSEEELVGTLLLMLSAGQETTLSLITNAVRALLTHPDQREIAVRGDADTWANVVEETLRWDAPIGNFPFRYPLEDVEIAGVRIPKGEAIMAPFSAVGRDTAQHGEDADRFDITRKQRKHLAFSNGPHFCLGAPLARLEAALALPAVFERYPDLAMAVDPDALIAVPSLFSNSSSTLPVQLGI
ncbi:MULTISPECIES: cytochrome P450 family protein [unclassified Streptomyces]|uniref:cytochrome P450 family protein n=1 Tax=unclassified Streptomyces TaxID=2593676 RepID=UPI00224D2856|nr:MULTISPECIES: cytochrome P450 [unclassified Streptomyces]MCX4785252.1 cytochrome P450 [Streptomyces sp. NBC_01221]WSJ40011.1 cytochrome P450 [Streptomyces sp. NBC_01321]WSP66312.1 cytochrome P450 [Streptomyces sp. NBC_01240]WSU25485.1 cytochrome P450 [Streptomyces sp. NBC_01108]